MKVKTITRSGRKHFEISDRFIIVFLDNIILVSNWGVPSTLGFVPESVEFLSCYDMVQPKVLRTRLDTLGS